MSSRRKIDLVIYAGASFTGWCITEWKITSGDRWRENEIRHRHINILQMYYFSTNLLKRKQIQTCKNNV